jgi:hypothetical protein
MRVRSLVAAVVCAVGLAVSTPALHHATASGPTWPPAASASVHPGVQLFTNGAQCTANFIYINGSEVYIGQAAHCSGTGGNTATNGCTSGSLPVGTSVQITGASRPGTVVYNSRLAMQAAHESNAGTCHYNDLALVKIDPADVGAVNPSVPFFGGPVAVNGTGLTQGATVHTYGNSELRGGVTALSPKRGISLGDQGGGWSHGTATVTPGIPGDSGSGLLDANGNAVGVPSTLEKAPTPGSNNFGDVSRELSYANSHGFSVSLVSGTAAFHAATLPPLPI